MREYKVIEIDGGEAGEIANGCDAAERLARAMADGAPAMPARLRKPYREALEEVAARLQIAARYLRELEIKAILANGVVGDEN